LRKSNRATFSRSILFVFCFFLAVSYADTGFTRDHTEEVKIFINYDYASDIDIGGFDTTGLSSLDFRIPISYTYRLGKDKNWGLKFKTDFNFGRYKFDGITGEGTSGKVKVAAISIVPGLEAIIPVRDYWSIIPFFQSGLGWGIVTDESPGIDAKSPLTYTFRNGIKNIFSWKLEKFRFRVGNTIGSGGNGTFDGDFVDVYAWIRNVIDVRHPLGFKIKTQVPDFGVYFTHTRYLPNTEFPHIEPRSIEIDDQFEIGAGIGLATSVRIEHEDKLTRKIINFPLKIFKKRIVVA